MRLSACIITKDDPRLADAVASIRGHVDEICIVDTGSADGGAFAESLADRFDVFTECNGPDGIENFAQARAASFAIATGDVIVWVDSDDIIDGAEHLRDMAVVAANGARVVCPYEYQCDPDTGRVTALQVRERIVANSGEWMWQRPVHEGLVRSDGERPVDVHDARAVWKHQRPVEKDVAHNARNLRILRAYAAEQGTSDPWVPFSLGMALAGAGFYDEAIAHLTQYVAASEWTEQRVVAYLQLADCELARNPTPAGADKALACAHEARRLQPEGFAPLYALAKLHFLKGCTNRGSMNEAIRCAKAAIGTPSVQQALGVNPVDRDINVHELLRVALDVVGDHKGALAEVRIGLRARPNDPTLLLAERDYLRATGVEPTKLPGALDIVFACGAAPEPWDPASIARTGMGGSETAVVAMAKGLAALGHRVRVFGDPSAPGLYDGVEYHSIHGAAAPTCDVLVAWRNAGLLEWGNAKTRLLWVHDIQAHNLNFTRAMVCDRVLALSEWHKANLVKAHGLHPDHVHVTRNGVDLERFKASLSFDANARAGIFMTDGSKLPTRNTRRAVYSSSPDRGLAALLDMWPAIAARVPGAELHVFYGFDGWKKARANDAQHMYLVDSLERRMRDLDGVTFHGRVDQSTLASAMLSSGAWLYPTWFDETSCITAMEVQAAGLRIVASARAALTETIGPNGALIEGDWLSDSFRSAFIDAAVDALSDDGVGARYAAQNFAADRFSWSSLVTEWVAMFRELLSNADACILPPYSQVAA